MDIRLETVEDFRIVENLTREAFWNLYAPGCVEHYIAHHIRKSKAFIKELDFVAVLDGQIVGNIMYTHSHVVAPDGTKHPTITFGPLSVLPAFQRQGIGSALVAHSKLVATNMGFTAIVIYGHPKNYHKMGFCSASKFGISRGDGKFAVALMAMPLTAGGLDGVRGCFHESEDFAIDEAAFATFEATFPPKEKIETPTQKEFAIISTTLEEVQP